MLLLSDFLFTSHIATDSLVYNGTKWVNGKISHADLLLSGTYTHTQLDAFMTTSRFTSGILNQFQV